MDEREKKILFDSFWSAKGWKANLPEVSKENLEYAINAGFMFRPIYMSHDEIIRKLKATVATLDKTEVVNGFLASLSTRRLELRSALGSYACSLSMAPHKFQNSIYASYYCEVCGMAYKERQNIDLNVYNFERYKWGGIRHYEASYALFDLMQFSKLEKAEPTTEDMRIFNQIIGQIMTISEKGRPKDLEKALGGCFKSNKDEREILIKILGYCGILETESSKGYYRHYPLYIDRATTSEWGYPVCHWRGKNKINLEAMKFYFPFYN